LISNPAAREAAGGVDKKPETGGWRLEKGRREKEIYIPTQKLRYVKSAPI
jgi:hypothetical protein